VRWSRLLLEVCFDLNPTNMIATTQTFPELGSLGIRRRDSADDNLRELRSIAQNIDKTRMDLGRNR
jgi:hypothetical protein